MNGWMLQSKAAFLFIVLSITLIPLYENAWLVLIDLPDVLIIFHLHLLVLDTQIPPT